MSGLGVEEIEDANSATPDFNRGKNGEPIIQMPDGKSKRYSRQSSHGETLEEKSGLNNWLIAKAVEGAAKDQSILARAIAASPYEDHKSDWTKIRQDAIQAGRGSYKADIGTAVHAMSERFEREHDYDPGPKFLPALEAYSKVQKDLGLVSQLIECQFVNDEHNTAGTADRLYELTKPLITPTDEVLPPGTLVVGDLKTGSSLEFSAPGYAIQIAGYAGGVLYDVVNNVRIPTPTINQNWAIIMHLDVESAHCEFIWIDLEVGRFGARLAEEVREWRRAWRRKDGYKATMQHVKVADSTPAPESAVEALSECEAKGLDVDKLKVVIVDEAEADLDAWIDYCRRRLDIVKETDEIKEWMLIRWPDGMLPPKSISSMGEAEALSKFLDRVEAEFGMQFVGGQPAPPLQRRER